MAIGKAIVITEDMAAAGAAVIDDPLLNTNSCDVASLVYIAMLIAKNKEAAADSEWERKRTEPFKEWLENC